MPEARLVDLNQVGAYLVNGVPYRPEDVTLVLVEDYTPSWEWRLICADQ